MSAFGWGLSKVDIVQNAVFCCFFNRNLALIFPFAMKSKWNYLWFSVKLKYLNTWNFFKTTWNFSRIKHHQALLSDFRPKQTSVLDKEVCLLLNLQIYEKNFGVHCKKPQRYFNIKWSSFPLMIRSDSVWKLVKNSSKKGWKQN